MMFSTLQRGLNSMGVVYRERGLRGIFVWIQSHLYERVRDVRSGVDTGVDGDETNRGDYVRYQPIPFAYLDTVFRLSGISDGNKGVLDYGCGKGRVVVEAAKHACTCVIGVDYDERLTTTAQNNVKKRQRYFACKDVSIVRQDATSFRVDDRVDVVIMNNPFTGDIMRRTLERIGESYERAPRLIQIYYVASKAEACLTLHASWLEKAEDELPLGVGSGRLLRCYTVASAASSHSETSDRTPAICHE